MTKKFINQCMCECCLKWRDEIWKERNEHEQRVAELEKERQWFRERLGPAGMKMILDIRKGNESRDKAIEIARGALEWINNPKHLRNMSQLASNPPKNGMVYDIQAVSRQALTDIENVLGAKGTDTAIDEVLK